MTVFQLILALGLPSLSVLVGILLNQYGIGRVDSRIDKLNTRMNKFEDRLLVLNKDMDEGFQLLMREFYRSLGQHDVRLWNLEKA